MDKGSSQVSMLNYIMDTDVLYKGGTCADGGKSFISKVKVMHSSRWVHLTQLL